MRDENVEKTAGEDLKVDKATHSLFSKPDGTSEKPEDLKEKHEERKKKFDSEANK